MYPLKNLKNFNNIKILSNLKVAGKVFCFYIFVSTAEPLDDNDWNTATIAEPMTQQSLPYQQLMTNRYS